MSLFFAPGRFVRLKDQPEWGIGQIQSVVESRVTVNFEHAGKQLINTDHVALVTVENETDVP